MFCQLNLVNNLPHHLIFITIASSVPHNNKLANKTFSDAIKIRTTILQRQFSLRFIKIIHLVYLYLHSFPILIFVPLHIYLNASSSIVLAGIGISCVFAGKLKTSPPLPISDEKY